MASCASRLPPPSWCRVCAEPIVTLVGERCEAGTRGTGVRLQTDALEPAASRDRVGQAVQTGAGIDWAANSALRPELITSQSVLALQRWAGNAAVTSLLRSRPAPTTETHGSAWDVPPAGRDEPVRAGGPGQPV